VRSTLNQKGSTGATIPAMSWRRLLWIVRTGLSMASWRDLTEAFWGLEQRSPALQSMEPQGVLVEDFEGVSDDTRLRNI